MLLVMAVHIFHVSSEKRAYENEPVTFYAPIPAIFYQSLSSHTTC